MRREAPRRKATPQIGGRRGATLPAGKATANANTQASTAANTAASTTAKSARTAPQRKPKSTISTEPPSQSVRLKTKAPKQRASKRVSTPAAAHVAVATRAGTGRRRFTHPVVTSLLTAILLSGCSNGSSTHNPNLGRAAFTEKDYGVSSSPRLVQNLGPVQKGGGSRKLGAPYRVAGKLYVPREDRNYEATGRASWYGFDFHGRKTANGEVFDSRALSAAHPTMPLPSYAYVTNLDNNRTVLVRVNDRGPYVGDRIIDMSQASADALGYRHKGTARVRVRYAGPAPLNGHDHHERRFLAEQPWSGSSAPRAALGGPRLEREPQRVSRTDGMWSPTAYRASAAAGSR